MFCRKSCCHREPFGKLCGPLHPPCTQGSFGTDRGSGRSSEALFFFLLLARGSTHRYFTARCATDDAISCLRPATVLRRVCSPLSGFIPPHAMMHTRWRCRVSRQLEGALLVEKETQSVVAGLYRSWMERALSGLPVI